MSHYTRRPQAFQYPGPTTKVSPRSSYPTFLSLQDSIILQLTWACRGLYDSFRWGAVVITIARCKIYVIIMRIWSTHFHWNSDAEIRANVYKSFLLNLLSLVSIYVFDLLLHPLVKDQEIWYHRNISRFYQVLWLLPVVGTSLYFNVKFRFRFRLIWAFTQILFFSLGNVVFDYC